MLPLPTLSEPLTHLVLPTEQLNVCYPPSFKVLSGRVKGIVVDTTVPSSLLITLRI